MRPEVRVVQGQTEEINNNPQIDSWEAEQLLHKYGYQNKNTSTNSLNGNNSELTFEEMINLEKSKLEEERIRKIQKINEPKPITFDGSGGYSSETKYSSDEDSGYGFKVQITSDMPIPKY
jgi:hypothetical protein